MMKEFHKFITLALAILLLLLSCSACSSEVSGQAQEGAADSQDKQSTTFSQTNENFEEESVKEAEGLADEGTQTIPVLKPEISSDAASESVASSSQEAEVQNAIAQCQATLEGLQDQYLEALNELEAKYRAEYSSLPEEERTEKKKAEYRNALIDEAGTLEESCDASVDEALLQLTNRLIELNSDLSPVSEMRNTYLNQKASTASALQAKMND